MMNRAKNLQQLTEVNCWDILIIGGGATGVGAALDAASRGYKTLLVEKVDFGKGTSSKSTKLVHGGVRYLAQGNYKLVKEALKERGLLLKNAPNTTNVQTFVLPVYSYWQMFYYVVGLKLYDILSGKWSLGKTTILGKLKTTIALPNISEKKLVGSIIYYDGQFNDTRLLIDIAKKANEFEACLLNYCEVEKFIKTDNKVTGVVLKDNISNNNYTINCKSVINATGVFADELMKLDNQTHEPIIAASQGIHLVIDASLFNGTNALMIPKTKDGRVLFAVPWNGVVIVGTTDTPINTISADPEALIQEINFITDHFNEYCNTTINSENIQSVFVGLRPLVSKKGKGHTALLSRDHSIIISESGVVNITGGKWTTYRKMAQDAIDNAAFARGLDKKKCITETLRINDLINWDLKYNHLKQYGIQADEIEAFIHQSAYNQQKIHPSLPITYGEIIWIIQHEMPQTIEDILARRTRILFKDVSIAIEVSEVVTSLLQIHLNETDEWRKNQINHFKELTLKFSIPTII